MADSPHSGPVTPADGRLDGRVAMITGAAGADDVSRPVRVTVAEFGKLDLLWANAGIGVAKTVPEMTVVEWTRVLAVNLTGALARGLAARPAGRKAAGAGPGCGPGRSSGGVTA